MQPSPTLFQVAQEHGIALLPEQAERLEEYCRLLWDWNSRLNLTRHTDYEKFVTRDLIDSLAFSQFLQAGEKVLDVGTGGGVPGVVLAVLRPELSLALCESVGKKVHALTDILDRMHLKLPLLHGRAEDLLAGAWKYNTLVIRAVAPLTRLLRWLRPRQQAFDRMLVLKGPAWAEERAEARHLGLLQNLALRRLSAYPLPGTESESVLLQICPKSRLVGEKECRLTSHS